MQDRFQINLKIIAKNRKKITANGVFLVQSETQS